MHEHSDLLKRSVLIKTPEGKSALLQLLPLTHKQENFEKYFSHLLQLRTHENKEVVLISSVVRNILFNRQCSHYTCDFVASFLFSLLLLDNDDISKPMEISAHECPAVMSQDKIIQKIQQRLNDFCLDSTIMQTMPHVMWLYSVLDIFKDYFVKDGQKPMLQSENTFFDEQIKNIIKTISSVHSDYNVLYKKIIVEQNRILRNFSSKERLDAIRKYKATILNRMAITDRLPEEFHKISDTKAEDSWIPVSIQQKKITSGKQRKKTKGRHRPHKKEALQSDEQQNKKENEQQEKRVSNFSSLIYDDRILRWFDRVFASTQSESSVVYHTINPLIDHFLVTLTKPEKRAKEHSDLEDTVYSLMGEIHYSSGRKQTVRFTCCIDPEGICYHRGPDKIKDQESLFAGSAYHVNFPPLFPDETHTKYEEKKVPLQNLIKNATYYENQFCIRMSDESNGIKEIILFKPLDL